MPIARLGVHQQYELGIENRRRHEVGGTGVGESESHRQQLYGKNRGLDGDEYHEGETEMEYSTPATSA